METPTVAAVCLCALALAAGGGLTWWFAGRQQDGGVRPESQVTFHGASVTISKHIGVKLHSDDHQEKLSGVLGKSLEHLGDYDIQQTDTFLSISFSAGVRLIVTYSRHGGVDRYDVDWTVANGSVSLLEDQFLMSGAHWYGCATVYVQLWPVEKWDRKVTAFVTGDSFKDYYGGTQERYWLSSRGAAIRVHPDTPLFVGINTKQNGLLTFQSSFSRPYSNQAGKNLSLKYSIIMASDVLSAQQYAANHFWKKPIGIPDKRVFRHPIWSTWAMYKKKLNQSLVLEFAREIRRHGFRHAQLEIDDDWTPHYGDHEFDAQKFPDARKMVDDLKDMGFRVTLWVHPFASIFSTSLWETDSARKSIWVRTPYGSLPNLGIWWDGLGASLDLTNPEAVDWFVGKLKHLEMKYGIDSFKYDAGESTWLPSWRQTHGTLDNPNDYTMKFVEVAYQADTDIRCQEVRTSVNTQHLPMFVRLMDKDSRWGHDNGLRSLIPNVLTFGLIGYPFVLPDMIGGNAYTGMFIEFTTFPDRELFIRWMEANALFPALQFSVPPWHYDENVTQIAHEVADLHEKYSDLIISLAEEAVDTGAPIVRPLWWVAPSDPVALTIDSEYLLGNDVLVAPVLAEGARERDVYLPAGRWRDTLRGGALPGGRWYRNYTALLHELPLFTRVTEDESVVVGEN